MVILTRNLSLYTLHNLQGHLSGFHFLTFNMNEFNVGNISIFKGKVGKVR